MSTHDVYSNFINQVNNSNYPESYYDFINRFAPIYAPIVLKSVEDSRQTYELKKHKDTDKYLYDLIIEYTKNFGKLHRPLTCVAAYLACKISNTSNLEGVLRIASSIENFQTAALIHDDIADKADIRRGKACLHLTEGTGLAINVGDMGLSLVVGSIVSAYKEGMLSTLNSEDLIKIIDRIISMEYMTIEGQAMDLGWARDNRYDISVDDYFTMATKKSAYYSAAIPCVIGAMCAGANKEIVDAFNEFGIKVGLAFQIQDDILNLIDFGDGSAAKNKDFMSDITEGKRTLVVVKTLELLEDKQKSDFIDILGSETTDREKLNYVVKLMQDCGAIEYAREIANNLCIEAKEIIESHLDESQWKNIILDMANWAKSRIN